MNSIYQFKHLSKKEVFEYFLKESSKACPNDAKFAWINQYIQQGGSIPNKHEYKNPLNIPAILRENRAKEMERYSLQPSKIHEVSKKALKSLEIKKANPGLAIDLGGGNSSLALTLLQRNWKVIVVDPSEKGLYLLDKRTHLQGLSSIAKSNLSLVPQKMEEFSFPSNVDFISAQASLPYCDASKVTTIWENIHRSLINGGYFSGNFFNSCSFDDPISNSDVELTRILDNDTPNSCKEITCRMQLGASMASPSVVHSLLKNSQYNIDYFSLDSTSIEFIGCK